MDDEYIFEEDNLDYYDEEKAGRACFPGLLVKRYRDERYKQKVSNAIRSCYHIFCPYGRSRTKRYALWEAMKTTGWRGHCRSGWYDPVFAKKLQNARVRYTKGTIPKGNQYRKINRRKNLGWKEEYDSEMLPAVSIYTQDLNG